MSETTMSETEKVSQALDLRLSQFLRDVTESQEEVNRLRAALKFYGRHTKDCDEWYLKPCSCGFNTVLPSPHPNPASSPEST